MEKVISLSTIYISVTNVKTLHVIKPLSTVFNVGGLGSLKFYMYLSQGGNKAMIVDVTILSNSELIQTYGTIIELLKDSGIIRSRNVVGDLGEYLAIEHYCKTPGLPKLQPAPTGTKNIDAISVNGERYSIKTTTGAVTGVFYGLNAPNSNEYEEKKFEYVLLVLLDSDMRLKRINELSWEQFLRHKRWHSRMRAWNLSVTKELLENTKTVT